MSIMISFALHVTKMNVWNAKLDTFLIQIESARVVAFTLGLSVMTVMIKIPALNVQRAIPQLMESAQNVFQIQTV